MTNFTHYIFGGEVCDTKTKMRSPSNDLIVIHQEAVIETIQDRIKAKDPNIPKCAPQIATKYFKETLVIRHKTTVHKVQAANNRYPEGRFCHQTTLIGAE